MNILADFHHAGLFFSLQLLFEKRLRHNLYRPIGMEWFKKGYWKLNNIEATARQYLDEDCQPQDKTQPLNNPSEPFEYMDYHHHTVNKGMTLDMFKSFDIDIVIASIPAHIAPFKELAHLKKAKFIFQQGNNFNLNLAEIPNLMSSTVSFPVPPSCNAVFYHQEFPLDIFKPTDKKPEKLLTSFINVYHENKGFDDYLSLSAIMPDYEFKSYGGQCRDGGVVGIENIASIMQRSYFGIHSKHMGDGFGHVLYNWYACGKPVITRISDYKGKLGEELLVDMETCIDITNKTPYDVKAIVENMSPLKYQLMCQEAYRIFCQKVDYDSEEQQIRNFLNNLR